MAMEINSKEFIESLSLFWGRLYSYNHILMKRSEDKQLYGKESFTDIIDFYITSQAQCLIKDFLLKHITSSGMLFTARCFLEGLALKRMYAQGKISELQLDLLRHQVHLIEYNYYKKFDDIASKILIPEKLIKDKDASAAFFREKLSDKFTEKQIETILKSDKPFLCDPHTNYRKLIGEYLSEKYSQIYGLYSQAIHPSVNDFYMNEKVWETVPDILLLIKQEFQSLPDTDLSFDNYCSLIYTSAISREYENLVRQECKRLIDIGEVFRSFFDKNYTTDTLMSIQLLLSEVCSDKLLGLSEQVKSKWKIIIDMFAAYYKFYISYFPREERFKLLEEHERIQSERNIGQTFSTERAYSFYKALYPNGGDQKNFDKGFLTLSGYTIDEEGKVQNLTTIVKEFIKEFKDPNAEVSWDRSMFLDYMESQMLSHANGYMWFANTGAWGDINNIIIGTDMCLIFILKSILSVFQIHKSTEGTKNYQTIINIVRNGIKKIREICNAKVKLLSIPGIAI